MISAEQLAKELHLFYRAAYKVLHKSSTFIRCGGEHDHGWASCHKQKYFLKRAEMIIDAERKNTAV